jgi:hypothetical protein
MINFNKYNDVLHIGLSKLINVHKQLMPIRHGDYKNAQPQIWYEQNVFVKSDRCHPNLEFLSFWNISS